MIYTADAVSLIAFAMRFKEKNVYSNLYIKWKK